MKDEHRQLSLVRESFLARTRTMGHMAHLLDPCAYERNPTLIETSTDGQDCPSYGTN